VIEEDHSEVVNKMGLSVGYPKYFVRKSGKEC